MHLGSTYRSRSSWLLALALLLKFDVTPSVEINTGSVRALTFIEVAVQARGNASGALRQRTSALLEHQISPGQIILMQEISRPERFAVLERETPAASTADRWKTHALTESLTDDLTAPPDQRLNREFDKGAPSAGPSGDVRANLYVITHVDIATPDRSRAETALHRLATAARRSDGNLGFEILQQIDRPNHFNLISAWLSESPFRAFAVSAEARQFRQTLGPLLGSPYDERLFRRID
ncbi:MAG TPA: antibiotic biosynthesis monooxygenase [Steroidobacteraceae bacterium]|nr:antibiotic biosynthesis monooxygenase [Steroidobacteraceae bacterium]